MWTQAVLLWLLQQGNIPGEVYAKASARLLGWKYLFTSANPDVMRAAGEEADWNPARWPLSAAIDYMSMDIVRPEDAASLLSRTVASGCVELVLPEARQALVQAAIEALARRADWRRAVGFFEQVLPMTFGLNFAGQQDAMGILRAWKHEAQRRVVLASR